VRQLLPDLPVFVAVAESGGFSAAAHELGLTPAAVSKAVRRLETSLRVDLFVRTTRKVALTPEGETFLARCKEAFAQLRAGTDALALAHELAEGRLRISLSFVLGRLLSARLPELLDRYPRLRVQLYFTDKLTRLVDEKVDVVLRLGPLEDSSLVAQPLLQTRWCTAASPAYLARHGTPQHPSELVAHRCLRFRGPRGNISEWTYLEGNETRRFPVPNHVDMDHGEYLVDAAVAGAGICHAFSYMVEAPIRSGRLVELFADRAAPGPKLHALTLAGRQRLPHIRAFTAFCRDVFASEPWVPASETP
jgi:LysR family transcriptional regulator, regulator for bpeEF and oprC